MKLAPSNTLNLLGGQISSHRSLDLDKGDEMVALRGEAKLALPLHVNLFLLLVLA